MKKPDLKPPKVNGFGSWLAILMVVVVGLAICIGLSFLTLGFFGPVLAIAAVVFGLIGFHYLAWGWWLGEYLKSRHDFEDE